MTPMVKIAMLGWFFAVVPALFIFLPKRTAAYCGLIFGWMLLPWGVHYQVGPIDVTRDAAVSVSVVLCIIIFDPMRFLRFRPSWIDLPILVWVTSSFFSSISNELGAYDGGATIQSHLIVWGLPYLIGRVYVTDAKAAKHLAMVLFFAMLLYVPLILWELRFSPQLHKRLYGYTTYDHGGTTLRRMGGWRPLVFMQHGLMLGVFTASASLLGLWLWHTKAVRSLPLLPPGMRGKRQERTPDGRGTRMVAALGPAVMIWPAVFGVLALTVMSRALNGLLLLVIGVAVLWALKHLKTRVPLVLFAVLPFAFTGLRISEHATGFVMDEPVLTVLRKISEDRAGSIEYRFRNEHLLTEKALQRPMLGWGGWSRNRVYDENGNDITVTDGFWIITLGQSGIIGMVSMFMTLLLPVFLLAKRFDAKALCSPELAAPTGLAVVVCMYATDCIPNAMLNPMYVMAAGGISGLLVVSKSHKNAQSRVPNRTRTVHAQIRNA